VEFALAPTEPQTAPPVPIPWEPPALRAVCFDVDDTLVDFSSASRRALADLIGRGDMWSLWERITDAHVAMVVAGDADYETMHRRRTRSFLAELGVDVDDVDAAQFEYERAAAMWARFRRYDDVVPCLDWLRAAGIGVAAVTNASGGHQRAKLDELGLGRFIDHVVIAGEVGAAKPDPRLFESACAALGCEPSEVMHVGDRLRTDAIGAHEAGLTGVWLDRGVAPRVKKAA
jgi:putative hydrolase of the HAD superfamily